MKNSRQKPLRGEELKTLCHGKLALAMAPCSLNSISAQKILQENQKQK